jgi:hypothetical protein
MANYSIYPGKFLCKTCKKEVKTMRVYVDTGMASWMCSDKHLSEIMLFKKGYKKVKQDD